MAVNLFTSNPQWLYVVEHFTGFLANLQLKPEERVDGAGKVQRIAQCLDAAYRPYQEYTGTNHWVVGSVGRGTSIRPPSDIDLLYFLPPEVYTRFANRTGNIQSALLQEVKAVLLDRFPNTAMRGDGQVVVVPFTTFPLEVVPCFRLENGQIMTCDTHEGGRWKFSDPGAQFRSLQSVDDATRHKATDLTQMVKAWKRAKNVPLRSLAVELLATEFAATGEHRDKTTFYYDWMVRDFFAWLCGQTNRWLLIPGSSDYLEIGAEWHTRARTAYSHALVACAHERDNFGVLAEDAWREIFGDYFPSSRSLLLDALRYGGVRR